MRYLWQIFGLVGQLGTAKFHQPCYNNISNLTRFASQVMELTIRASVN